MLVARAGLGAAELRLIDPTFLASVRWALYAEKLSDGLGELRAAVANDPDDALKGATRIAFIEARKRMREDLSEREAALYPPDEPLA